VAGTSEDIQVCKQHFLRSEISDMMRVDRDAFFPDMILLNFSATLGSIAIALKRESIRF